MAKKLADSLTKSIIDRLVPVPGKRDRMLFDGEIAGFGVRATSAGHKVFFFQYRHGGQLRRYKIGAYGAMTLHQARTAAEALRVAVAAGGDPVGATKAAEAAREAAVAARAVEDAFTVTVLLDRWAATALADRSATYRKEAPRAVRVLLGPLAASPAPSLTKRQVQGAVDAAIVTTPVQGVMARNYGRAAFNWAMRRGYVTANPFAAIAIERRERPRDRVLTDAELGDIWRATGSMVYPFGPLIRIMVLTMQRRGEVAGMTWREVSPDLATWTIPAARAKNGRQHQVHLVEAARVILRSVPRAPNCDLVFTTTGTSVVSGFNRARTVLAAKIGMATTPAAPSGTGSPAAWVLHDFRRTGVTKLAELGIAPHIADRILNHVAGTIRGVMATYQRFEFLPERQRALEIWAAHVLAVAEGEPAASNVTTFPRSARPA